MHRATLIMIAIAIILVIAIAVVVWYSGIVIPREVTPTPSPPETVTPRSPTTVS